MGRVNLLCLESEIFLITVSSPVSILWVESLPEELININIVLASIRLKFLVDDEGQRSVINI